MRNLTNLAAKKTPQDAATELAGHVTAKAGNTFTIRSDGELFEAKRAASCLLEPNVGDRVLVATIADGSAYVLAVLVRAGEEPATLSVEGDCALRLPSGQLQVTAAEGISLVSAKTIATTAPTIEMNAIEGKVGISRLALVGKELFAEIAQTKATLGSLDTVADRLMQKAKRVYRFVEELDQLRAKRVDYSAEKSLHLHGENALVTADSLVKMDGEHIHMG